MERKNDNEIRRNERNGKLKDLTEVEQKLK